MAFLPLPAIAQAPSPAAVIRIDVTLSNFRFDPSEIVMVHGRRYDLHFVNAASGGHNFIAKSFFAAATMTPEERRSAADGEVGLKGHGQTSVTLIAPAPGTYEFHCGHFMHETFGMKGHIKVE